MQLQDKCFSAFRGRNEIISTRAPSGDNLAASCADNPSRRRFLKLNLVGFAVVPTASLLFGKSARAGRTGRLGPDRTPGAKNLLSLWESKQKLFLCLCFASPKQLLAAPHPLRGSFSALTRQQRRQKPPHLRPVDGLPYPAY